MLITSQAAAATANARTRAVASRARRRIWRPSSRPPRRGRGPQCERRPAGLVQPQGAAHHGGTADAPPRCREAPGGDFGPPRRRPGRCRWPRYLTATEYELLRILSLDAGRVVTFETLLRRLWAKRENADANLVRNLVRNLRRKLSESAASPTWLFNDRGVGYLMAKPPNR